MPQINIDDAELYRVVYSPVCLLCLNLIDPTARRCSAFDNIPPEIWDGDNKHKTPLPNQGNDVVYEEIAQ